MFEAEEKSFIDLLRRCVPRCVNSALSMLNPQVRLVRAVDGSGRPRRTALNGTFKIKIDTALKSRESDDSCWSETLIAAAAKAGILKAGLSGRISAFAGMEGCGSLDHPIWEWAIDHYGALADGDRGGLSGEKGQR